jgi:hypothetical protein
MRRHLAVVVVPTVLVLAAAATAQTDRLTGHPQDLPHVNTGQAAPLSDWSNGCEARSQLLFRARHLPGPGAVLVGIEFFAMSPGAVQYESLAITVSPVSPTAVRWMDFQLNLPQPTTIVQFANQPINWNGAAWDRLPVIAPYAHDGVSDLTIDIQKDAVSSFGNGACTSLFRPDLETMLIRFGVAGSGQALATTANLSVIPIDVRLVWDGAPVSRLRSTVPGANHHGFAVGTSLDHIVNATPSSLAALAGDLQWSNPVTLPFASGQWWAQGVVLGLDVVAANGEVVRTYPIPLATQFIGQQIVYQALVLDAVSGALQFTNGSDCFLGQ